MNWHDFHFLRAAWLLALIPLVPLGLLLWRRASDASAWRAACDSHLLRHLLIEHDGRHRAWPLAAFASAWVVTTLALAGPTWEQLPTPTFALNEPTVLVLNMARSMDTPDIAPSRMARARFKLIDAIAHLGGAPAGLVIFNEEPYVVTPVTDDGKVIAETVPMLTTDLMPGRGMRVDRALAEAGDLIVQSGATRGRILLVTDGVGDAPDESLAAARAADAAGFPVSVLSVGGDAAADALKDLAAAGGGTFAALSADDRDLVTTLPERSPDPDLLGAGRDPFGARIQLWRDMGGWLVLLPLLLALVVFRRGHAVACSGVFALALVAPPAHAGEVGELGDLFRTPDQRGAAAFEQGHHDEAAAAFEHRAWRGAAQYRSGDYAGAIETLGPLKDTDSRYNLGNALARSQQLEEALAAYDEVLARQPDHADARHNRDLVQQLLDQQQQQGDGESPDEQQDQQQGDESGEQESQPQDGEGSESPQDRQGESGEQESQSQDGQGSESQQEQPSDGQSGEQPEQQQGRQQSQQQGQQQDQPQQEGQAGEQAQDEPPSGQQAGQPADGKPQQGEDRPAGADGRPDDDSGQAADQGQTADPGDERRAEGRPDPASAQPTDAEPTDNPPVPLPGRLSEQDQATEQMLGRIPDDPGGLLREKLRRRYLRDRYGRLPRGSR